MPGAERLLFKWRAAIVIDRRLSAADRHVALTLSLHMDLDGGSCYPSTRLLAAEAARKPHTVIKSVQTLEACDYLSVRRGGKRNAKGWSSDVNEYQAQMPLGTTGADAPSGTPQMPLGAHKLFKSTGGARKSSPAVCDNCGTGGGNHAADCPTLEEAA